MTTSQNKKRRVGFGSVVVNGKVMTTDMYKNAVIRVLKETCDWLTVPQIIRRASDMGLCEPDDAPRKAVAHPIYKCISMMMEEKAFLPIIRMKDEYGKWVYYCKEPMAKYINGNLVRVLPR